MTDDQILELCVLWEENKLRAGTRYMEINEVFHSMQMSEALIKVKQLYDTYFR